MVRAGRNDKEINNGEKRMRKKIMPYHFCCLFFAFHCFYFSAFSHGWDAVIFVQYLSVYWYVKFPFGDTNGFASLIAI